ncbi:MAG: hypothetical protein FWG81_11075 [Betaproteobacteria bacterium]|nr:hypothetical protein [Betaproteobacteria bacterium]
MADRCLRLHAGNAALRAGLHSVRRVAGPTGIPRLVAERDDSGQADRFWAIALVVTSARFNSCTRMACRASYLRTNAFRLCSLTVGACQGSGRRSARNRAAGVYFVGLASCQTRVRKRFDLIRINDADHVASVGHIFGNGFPAR